MRAGQLRERVTFAVRGTGADDGYGNTLGAWSDQFTVSARVKPLRGGETVLADRLAGRQPVVITVRRSDSTATITPDWRAEDARSGTVYNIRAVTPGERHDLIDLLAESGVAE